MRRLLAALEVANASLQTIQACDLSDGKIDGSTPRVVSELHDAFVAATRVATSSLPWKLLRALSLKLHNELSATSAALGLTLVALRTASGNKAADDLRSALVQDERKLRALLLDRELGVAVAQKQARRVRLLIQKIIPLLDDAAEISKYQAVLNQLTEKFVNKVIFRTALAGLATLIVLAIISQDPGRGPQPRQSSVPGAAYVPTPQSSVASSPQPAPGAGSVGQRIAAAPAVLPTSSQPVPPQRQPAETDRVEAQPAPGTTVLSKAELRWCRYRKVASAAAQGWLEQTRWSGPEVNRFNAAVDAYNANIQLTDSLCASRQFWVRDREQVDAEVAAASVGLENRGRLLVQAAYESSVPARFSPGGPTWTPPPAPQPQASGFAVPASLETAAFEKGQSDRRAWEAWVAGLSGSFRDGVEWWAGVRSTTRPPSCAAAPGADRPSAVAGCEQAKLWLTSSDVRRRSEPDYRRGWNNP